MAVKRKPKAQNGLSRQRGIRIAIPDDDYMQKKAVANPANRYNQLASEVNDLVANDHDHYRRTGKFRFRRKPRA